MSHYYLIHKHGFEIDSAIAEELGLLDEYILWEEEYDDEPFCRAFENKYGIYPESLRYFAYEREGYVQSLSGFDWDTSYVIFDDIENHPQEWERLNVTLEEALDVLVTNGQWAELG